ncbi:tetratricopeptide repeat protein [Fulvivirga kasyanovii]|uniref:Tetratricopeptide repeat protein n=1 Tax=Fulvivirga kasyanovii TaxID=396812 RepID=A0ABW9RJG2_9BACT|nr:tetratricopeptide repeat protein [Fulvivirga kasyanovii]MTI24218.1 tetratricopeptide repeat protein [Fulvivirga kasyanovii]
MLKTHFFATVRLLILLAILCNFSLAVAQQKTEIQVLSATVKDQTIQGATIIFQKNGETSVTATTDSQGRISIPSPFGGVDDPSVTIIIKKDGYSTLVAKGPYNNLTYALSPTMQELDGIRIVLNWGSSPEDLDSHISYPGNHICYHHKTGSLANLDVDDVDGYGPETITIERKAQGQKYVYAVHNYSAKDMSSNTDLSAKSNASVFVYIGNTLIRTYKVPEMRKAGNLWIVFMIDEYGTFVDINKFQDASTWERVRANLETFRGKDESFGDPVISQNDIQESKVANRKGEEAYHAGNLELSVELYQKAIELNPNNGQAYSNLGLSFQKLNREAEAIWANRKAISLANGPHTSTIQASSYYNIGKIYEKKGQWADALQHYSWARERKQHSAYDNGIRRMNEKLGNN